MIPISIMSVLRSWLPPPEVESALTDEPRRFKAVLIALRADWQSQELSKAAKNARLMEWIDLLERYDCFDCLRVTPGRIALLTLSPYTCVPACTHSHGSSFGARLGDPASAEA